MDPLLELTLNNYICMSNNVIIVHLHIYFPDNDECLNNPCDIHASCTNSDGSYACSCNQGFSGDGHKCDGKMINYLAKIFIQGWFNVGPASKTVVQHRTNLG